MKDTIGKKTTTVTGWVLLPADKQEREIRLQQSIYQTLFVDPEYLEEFRERWAPDLRPVKATLTIETP